MGQEPDHQTADQYDREEILRKLVCDLLDVDLYAALYRAAEKEGRAVCGSSGNRREFAVDRA